MIITSKTPYLDLHGEEAAMAEVLVNEFINDNYLLKNKYVVIIHGKSTNILTNIVHQTLKKNEKVLKFQLNNWNLGETYIELKL